MRKKTNKIIECELVGNREREKKRGRIKSGIMLSVIVFFFAVLGSTRLIGDATEKEIPLEVSSDVAVRTATPTPTPSVVHTKINLNVNYKTEKIILSSGPGGSTKFFISSDKMKTWELIEDTSKTVDLNGYLKSSQVTLYFKGNKDLEAVMLILPKEETTLKVTYRVENGVGRLLFAGVDGELQYRLNASDSWEDYKGDLPLSQYAITGMSIQFRTKATPTRRAGKIVTVKVAKRPTAPNVKVDYSKFTITGLKMGATQYRVSNSDKWVTFQPSSTSDKILDLRSLLLPSDTSNGKAPIPAGIIEFRTLAEGNKLASGIKVIEIERQRTAPSSTVKLVDSTITFTDASKDNPYEYVVCTATEVFDPLKAKWKKVMNDKPIVIKKTGSNITTIGDRVYVRYASVKDSTSNVQKLASLYNDELTITKLTLID